MSDQHHLLSLLGVFTAGDAGYAIALAKKELHPRAFFEQLFEQKFQQLSDDKVHVSHLSDDALAELAISWIQLPTEVLASTKQESRIRQVFQSVEAYLQSLFLEFTPPPDLVVINMEALQQFENPHYLRALREFEATSIQVASALQGMSIQPDFQLANQIAKSFDEFQQSLGITANIPSEINKWNQDAALAAEQALAFERIGITHISAANNAMMQRVEVELRQLETLAYRDIQLAEHARLSIEMIEAVTKSTMTIPSLERIANEMAGRQLQFSDVAAEALTRQLSGVAESYAEFVKSVSEPSQFPTAIGFLEAASTEFFSMVDAVEAITVEPVQTDFWTWKVNKRSELLESNELQLRILLRDIEPNLVSMLDGAIQAASVEYPDHLRHFSTSSRELLSHILRILAPEELVKNWTNNPELYDKKGDPTRRARLLYICRHVSQPPLSTVFKKQIDTTLELIEVLHGGTHREVNNLTKNQLQALRLLVESTLHFLIKVSIQFREPL